MDKSLARIVCATLLISAPTLARGNASETAQESPSDLTVIRNARLITMTGRGVLDGMAIVVREGRIDRIVPQAELKDVAGASQIDAAGGSIVPGYVDAHMHYRHPDELLNYLAYGVTTVVSLGEAVPHSSRDLLRLRDAISSGAMVGPRIYTTAGVVPETVNPETADGARTYVRQLAADGYDLVKVYNDVSKEVFDAIVDEGRRSGLSVFGHIPRNFPATYSLSHGLDVVAHAEEFYFTYFDGARDRDLAKFRPTQLPDIEKAAGLIELLLQHRVAVIPNLAGSFAQMVFYDDDEAVFADPELRYLHPKITNQ